MASSSSASVDIGLLEQQLRDSDQKGQAYLDARQQQAIELLLNRLSALSTVTPPSSCPSSAASSLYNEPMEGIDGSGSNTNKNNTTTTTTNKLPSSSSALSSLRATVNTLKQKTSNNLVGRGFSHSTASFFYSSSPPPPLPTATTAITKASKKPTPADSTPVQPVLPTSLEYQLTANLLSAMAPPRASSSNHHPLKNISIDTSQVQRPRRLDPHSATTPLSAGIPSGFPTPLSTPTTEELCDEAFYIHSPHQHQYQHNKTQYQVNNVGKRRHQPHQQLQQTQRHNKIHQRSSSWQQGHSQSSQHHPHHHHHHHHKQLQSHRRHKSIDSERSIPSIRLQSKSKHVFECDCTPNAPSAPSPKMESLPLPPIPPSPPLPPLPPKSTSSLIAHYFPSHSLPLPPARERQYSNATRPVQMAPLKTPTFGPSVLSPANPANAEDPPPPMPSVSTLSNYSTAKASATISRSIHLDSSSSQEGSPATSAVVIKQSSDCNQDLGLDHHQIDNALHQAVDREQQQQQQHHKQQHPSTIGADEENRSTVNNFTSPLPRPRSPRTLSAAESSSQQWQGLEQDQHQSQAEMTVVATTIAATALAINATTTTTTTTTTTSATPATISAASMPSGLFYPKRLNAFDHSPVLNPTIKRPSNNAYYTALFTPLPSSTSLANTASAALTAGQGLRQSESRFLVADQENQIQLEHHQRYSVPIVVQMPWDDKPLPSSPFLLLHQDSQRRQTERLWVFRDQEGLVVGPWLFLFGCLCPVMWWIGSVIPILTAPEAKDENNASSGIPTALNPWGQVDQVLISPQYLFEQRIEQEFKKKRIALEKRWRRINRIASVSTFVLGLVIAALVLVLKA